LKNEKRCKKSGRKRSSQCGDTAVYVKESPRKRENSTSESDKFKTPPENSAEPLGSEGLIEKKRVHVNQGHRVKVM
jgi:hypothetical protein